MTQEVRVGDPDGLEDPHTELLDYVYDWYEMQLGPLHRDALEEAVDDPSTPVTIKYDRDYQPIHSWTGVAGFEAVSDTVKIEIDRSQGTERMTESHVIAPNWREVPDELNPLGPQVVVSGDDDEDDGDLPEIDLNDRKGLLSEVTEQCPGCGTEFDEDTWEKDVRGGDLGGVCHYECPAEGCDGRATFDW